MEIIDKGGQSATHSTPLLFVHGTSHAAWCWDEHFLDYFVEQGYRAVALSLRGHGGSSSSRPLRFVSIADYVNDVRSVADTLTTTPVLIGHSLGGFVVQKYLESYHAPASVLLASTPVRGIWGLLLRTLVRYPQLSLRTVLAGRIALDLRSPALAREWFFSRDLHATSVARYAAQLQLESDRALIDALFRLPRPERVRTPVLVLGAQNDRVFTVREIRATARAYGVEASIIPDAAHDMMLDTRWRTPAAFIVKWLGELSL
ncbi:MAG: alpha/beta hydrolase [Solirubrobacteraceae bacterium]